jgi:glycosyltransferase involved in cell wall biosynthesis
MNIYVITIHNPGISFGPQQRLESFLKEAEDNNINFILPTFPEPKKHTKLKTIDLTKKILFDIIKNRKKIDRIHVVTPPSYPGLVALFAKKALKIPYIVDVGDPCAENMAAISNFSQKSLKFKILKRIDQILFKNAHHIILTSPEIEQYIPKQVPYTTILTGLTDTDNLQPKQPANNKKCLYLGNYGPLQNLEYLIRVFSRAIKQDSDLHLDIYGTGEREKLENLVKELKSDENIIFHDPIPVTEIPKLSKKYSLGLVSLNLEMNLNYAIPTKLLHSLTLGLPVFGTGGKATQDIIRKSQAGFISTQYNEKRDAYSLLDLLSNHRNLDNYSKNATQFAKKFLTYENTIKNYKLTLQ